MKKSPIAIGLALLTSGLSHAGTYQTEITPSYSTGEIEVGSADVDIDEFRLGGEYYFGGVDDSKGPLAEAAFLDRASSVRASYGMGEIDGNGGDLDTDRFSLGGRFVDSASGWIFSIDYSEFEIDDGGDETETWDFSVGKYIAENTAVTFTYRTEEEGNDDTDFYVAEVKHIAELSGGAYLSLEGLLAIGDADERDDPIVYGGSFTYYPTRHFGIGALAALEDSDDTEETTYSIFGSWFASDTLAVTASYDIVDDDEINVESDVFTIGAILRF
ncbi:putative porin [Exilibacterium tricleocarpae]|uniref:Putative porin n=1 Tax=Exilibacterium tricleocarpae TaxID=2591008 RepID=A0A545UA01_9GAMM|nr:putative porin [Exilibacterium tricleocarpae]TQV86305.1 putative porin [Exilibacterium tricleocarpae]